jgi:hypothetical protein
MDTQVFDGSNRSRTLCHLKRQSRTSIQISRVTGKNLDASVNDVPELFHDVSTDSLGYSINRRCGASRLRAALWSDSHDEASFHCIQTHVRKPMDH